MNRDGGAPGRLSGFIWKTMSVMILTGLVACGDNRNLPGPPHGPPRPVTGGAFLETAHFDLPSRPVMPSPGMM